MADCTYLNNIPAYRIHKQNADVVLEENRESLTSLREEILLLAGATPRTIKNNGFDIQWEMYVTGRINDLLEEIKDNILQVFFAEYIIDYPEDCLDELDKDDREKL